jgi:hypothetical protein
VTRTPLAETPGRLPDESASIRSWVAQAPAGFWVRTAQLSLLGWAGASVLVQLIPVPSPSAMDVLTAVLYVLQWLVVTLWIPVAALVWGRRRRGFIFAAGLLLYSLGYQLLADWLPWANAVGSGGTLSVGFPGARRSLKLALTLASLAAGALAAPKQPD